MAKMMMSTDVVVCSRCGKGFPSRRGKFYPSYSALHKGIGYMPYCKECVDKIFLDYLSQCDDAKDAMRQLCRKLDLYWNEDLFDSAHQKGEGVLLVGKYITKINSSTNAGKSYDNTLLKEGTFWNFKLEDRSPVAQLIAKYGQEEIDDKKKIPDEWISFWGSGYTYDMYEELERRRAYYMSKLPEGAEIDIGAEVLIKQICNLEVSISRDAAAGKAIDKSVNSLNTLLGSLNLRPAQKKNDDAESDLTDTPLGVWLYRWENKRPLPETDPSLKDKNHIKKYVFTWLGHVCKMLGVKNGYTKMYEEEIERLRVERPEYDEEDDETLLVNAYSDVDTEGSDLNE